MGQQFDLVDFFPFMMTGRGDAAVTKDPATDRSIKNGDDYE